MQMKSRSAIRIGLAGGRLLTGAAAGIAAAGLLAGFIGATSSAAVAQDAKSPPPPPPGVLEVIQTPVTEILPSPESAAPVASMAADTPAAASSTDQAPQHVGQAAGGAEGVNESEAATDTGTQMLEFLTGVPAARPAANDESARLAAEVPAEDVAVPAGEWLSQDVGEIATRPVVESGPSVESLEPEVATVNDESANRAEAAVENADGPETAATVIVDTEPAPAAVSSPIEVISGKSVASSPGTSSSDSSSPGTIPARDPVLAGEIAEAPAGDAATLAESPRPAAPTIVSIKADFSKRAGALAGSHANVQMKGPAALPERAFGVHPEARFALVWIDGSQRSGDTFVKFWQPSRVFFAGGRSCLEWARDEATEGRALAPSGIQPGELQAACLAGDGSGEFWIWRQRSGAFSKSVLMPAQARFFQEVIRSWSASSTLAYGEFPEPPYAGQ